MSYCPVCEKDYTGDFCIYCGFTESEDIVKYRTVAAVNDYDNPKLHFVSSSFNGQDHGRRPYTETSEKKMRLIAASTSISAVIIAVFSYLVFDHHFSPFNAYTFIAVLGFLLFGFIDFLCFKKIYVVTDLIPSVVYYCACCGLKQSIMLGDSFFCFIYRRYNFLTVLLAFTVCLFLVFILNLLCKIYSADNNSSLNKIRSVWAVTNSFLSSLILTICFLIYHYSDSEEILGTNGAIVFEKKTINNLFCAFLISVAAALISGVLSTVVIKIITNERFRFSAFGFILPFFSFIVIFIVISLHYFCASSVYGYKYYSFFYNREYQIYIAAALAFVLNFIVCRFIKVVTEKSSSRSVNE